MKKLFTILGFVFLASGGLIWFILGLVEPDVELVRSEPWPGEPLADFVDETNGEIIWKTQPADLLLLLFAGVYLFILLMVWVIVRLSGALPDLPPGQIIRSRRNVYLRFRTPLKYRGMLGALVLTREALIVTVFKKERLRLEPQALERLKVVPLRGGRALEYSSEKGSLRIDLGDAEAWLADAKRLG